MVPDISVKDQLKKLVELQKIDSEKYDINEQLNEKPKLIENLKNQFETSKQAYHDLDIQLKDIQLKRKEVELELKAKEEEILKGNVALNQLKTNKEYQAKISEIESLKADKSVMEEKILESFDSADAVAASLAEEKKNVDQNESIFNSKKKEVEDEVKELEDRLKVLEGQRNQVIPEIDSSFIERYDRILKHTRSSAIVPVVASACSGCHMNVTPQKINLIKMGDEMVTCEMCARIIYIEEDL